MTATGSRRAPSVAAAGDEPGRLDRVLGDSSVAADEGADAEHLTVMGADDEFERDLIAGHG